MSFEIDRIRNQIHFQLEDFFSQIRPSQEKHIIQISCNLAQIDPLAMQIKDQDAYINTANLASAIAKALLKEFSNEEQATQITKEDLELLQQHVQLTDDDTKRLEGMHAAERHAFILQNILKQTLKSKEGVLDLAGSLQPCIEKVQGYFQHVHNKAAEPMNFGQKHHLAEEESLRKKRGKFAAQPKEEAPSEFDQVALKNAMNDATNRYREDASKHPLRVADLIIPVCYFIREYKWDPLLPLIKDLSARELQALFEGVQKSLWPPSTEALMKFLEIATSIPDRDTYTKEKWITLAKCAESLAKANSQAAEEAFDNAKRKFRMTISSPDDKSFQGVLSDDLLSFACFCTTADQRTNCINLLKSQGEPGATFALWMQGEPSIEKIYDVCDTIKMLWKPRAERAVEENYSTNIEKCIASLANAPKEVHSGLREGFEEFLKDDFRFHLITIPPLLFPILYHFGDDKMKNNILGFLLKWSHPEGLAAMTTTLDALNQSMKNMPMLGTITMEQLVQARLACSTPNGYANIDKFLTLLATAPKELRNTVLMPTAAIPDSTITMEDHNFSDTNTKIFFRQWFQFAIPEEQDNFLKFLISNQKWEELQTITSEGWHSSLDLPESDLFHQIKILENANVTLKELRNFKEKFPELEACARSRITQATTWQDISKLITKEDFTPSEVQDCFYWIGDQIKNIERFLTKEQLLAFIKKVIAKRPAMPKDFPLDELKKLLSESQLLPNNEKNNINTDLLAADMMNTSL